MGNRLSKIYTRTGDDGTTSLGDGTRIEKDTLRIEAIGDLDELNSYLGEVLSHLIPEVVQKTLLGVQHDLFDIGAELSQPAEELVKAEWVLEVEKILDDLNNSLPALREFILPGGGQAAATCHVARTICRRAERKVVALSKQEKVNPVVLQYINRLSDLLFVMCRVLARDSGEGEVFWNPDRNKLDKKG